MKKVLPLLLLALLCLAACTAPAEETLNVVLATDMHYLSPSLTDYSERFMDTVYAADGKVIHYSPQICRAFARDMLRLHPDAVILSGDLTLNGATISHEEFAALLSDIRAAGIPVFVIPGNHDVDGYAYSFSQGGAIAFPAATAEQFLAFYEACGYEQALSRDPASLSYIARLSDRVWAVMLDVNANGAPGQVTQATLSWLGAELKAARAQGVAVIGVSHQNLLPHNAYFTQGVMIGGAEALQALYRQYGVRLNLSGHTHMQHITEADTVEIVTSSMVLSPGYYGVVTLTDGAPVSYRAVPVDVDGWAAETGETDPDLLSFRGYTDRFYREVVRLKIASAVTDPAIPAEERRRMTDFGIDLSVCDFSGTRAELQDTDALALWEKYLPDSGFTWYFRGALLEAPVNMDTYVFEEQ